LCRILGKIFGARGYRKMTLPFLDLAMHSLGDF
jgi:hypothetical protein